MAITRARAIKLLSATEYRLYEATRRGRVGDHGATRLQKMLESAKKQQAKQRTVVTKRTRGGSDAGESTALKAEVFVDIVTRLEDALQRAMARSAPERGRPRPKAQKAERKRQRPAPRKSAQERIDDQRERRASKSASRKKKAAKRPSKLAAKASRERRETSMKAHAEAAPTGAARRPKGQLAADRAHLAHAAARGKRNQAKRDAKRG